jgi:accessory gene regulator protein AgrB
VDHDLGDMLQELRILLQGAQVLTAFLIILPFSEGFAEINQIERWVYLSTFLCSIISLVLFTAPAAHHRLQRPVLNRARFKDFATRMIIIGLVPLTLSLVLSTQLVVSTVLGDVESLVAAGLVAVLAGVIWWVLPLAHKEQMRR